MSAGVFGDPVFSPSGDRVAFVVERAVPRAVAESPSYWQQNQQQNQPPSEQQKQPPSEQQSEGQGDAQAALESKALRRGLGEALCVESASLLVWEWRGSNEADKADASQSLLVLNGEGLLPASEFSAGEVS